MVLEQEVKKDVGDHSPVPPTVSLPCRNAIHIFQNHRLIQGFLYEALGLGITQIHRLISGAEEARGFGRICDHQCLGLSRLQSL
jgi:hypothetical protein